ncbi:MAG: hypothetical protein RLY86_2637 [Pseudomonadota bacterium]|jgi:hypothetical protein
MSIPPDSRRDGGSGQSAPPALDTAAPAPNPAPDLAPNPATGALHSDPHANARDADRVLGGDAAKRREVEQAQANKHAAEQERDSGTLGAVAGINTAMTSRD